jgi:hypothetical protein
METIDHVFERLRSGTVPEQGLDNFAVGIDKPLKEINRQLGLAQNGQGGFKFLRGGYGCGKTFMGQFTLLEALRNNFAVSFVVVSPNDTQFYKFDEVYQKIVSGLRTKLAKRGALEDCIDRWISTVEDQIAAEVGNDASDFDERVEKRFETDLAALSRESMGREFINVIKAYFNAKQNGEYQMASSLIAWISGSKNVAAAAKKTAGIKGEISSSIAMLYLNGILNIIKKAGHPGMLVVLDELETVLRMRRDIREKSLNGLRQIIDASKDFPGLLWLFTGTREFFDSSTGVASLKPLHDRIQFTSSGTFVNTKQPQLELLPFDQSRLTEVAVKLRAIFPTDAKETLYQKVNDDFIKSLVAKVTEGLNGDVGVIPRQFLRELVNVFDLVNDNLDEYNPSEVYQFAAQDLSPEEQSGQSAYTDEELERIELERERQARRAAMERAEQKRRKQEWEGWARRASDTGDYLDDIKQEQHEQVMSAAEQEMTKEEQEDQQRRAVMERAQQVIARLRAWSNRTN